jgi:hypothetical protein
MRGSVRGDAELMLSESSGDEDDSMLDVLAAFSPRLISICGLTLLYVGMMSCCIRC